MRCKICNVDVSDNTKKCPLCGSETVADEPVIKGMKTAYYPKVEYVKPKPPYNAITAIAWVAITLLTFIIDMTSNHGDLTLTLFAATTIPCVWSFLLRPLYTSYYYFGRFVIADTVFLSLWLTVVSKRIFASVVPAVSYMIPAVLTVALLVFFFNSLAVKKDLFRAPPYVIILAVLSLLVGIISLFISGAKFYFCLIPLVVAILIFAILFKLSPEKVKSELQARFHS